MTKVRIDNNLKEWLDGPEELHGIRSDHVHLNIWVAGLVLQVVVLVVLDLPELLQLVLVLHIHLGDEAPFDVYHHGLPSFLAHRLDALPDLLKLVALPQKQLEIFNPLQFFEHQLAPHDKYAVFLLKVLLVIQFEALHPALSHVAHIADWTVSRTLWRIARLWYHLSEGVLGQISKWAHRLISGLWILRIRRLVAIYSSKSGAKLLFPGKSASALFWGNPLPPACLDLCLRILFVLNLWLNLYLKPWFGARLVFILLPLAKDKIFLIRHRGVSHRLQAVGLEHLILVRPMVLAGIEQAGLVVRAAHLY